MFYELDFKVYRLYTIGKIDITVTVKILTDIPLDIWNKNDVDYSLHVFFT